jgi:LuxR family maltose regulon positive regulatory protein
VVELGLEALAMDRHEAGALLQAADVELSDAEVVDLVRRTEGWPVAVDLAALSWKATGPGTALEGAGSLLADYLRSVLLSPLAPSTVRFLIRTAVLDRMSGPLCDAALDTHGSSQMLESLEQSNLLLVAVDRGRRWYRYHQLFRELLRAELKLREPELMGELTRRAATWCEHHGLPEAAIDYAMQADDADRAARLVARLGVAAHRGGRLATVRRWLDWFDDHGLIERYPTVAVLGAWVNVLVGRAAAAERWADAAERGSRVGTLADDRTSIEGELALLRAAMCRDGIAQARNDAALAEKLMALGSPWRATTLLLLGMFELLGGEVDHADDLLAEAVEVADDSGATVAGAVALAERALVAIGRNGWEEAELLAERARSLVRDTRPEDYPTSSLLYAVAARLAIRRGAVPQAREELARAQALRPHLTHTLPIFAVQTRLELARAHLALTDVTEARTVLRETNQLLLLRPDLGMLGQQADQLHAQLHTVRDLLGASSLTAAELRLLPLLSTHHSLDEIGEHLHLSRHTVKSQTIAIYRKLGVSSRSQAVRRVRELGLSG